MSLPSLSEPSHLPILEHEYSSQLPHNISRTWYLIRDANLTSLLFPELFFPLTITKGKDTWGINTQFKCQTTSNLSFIVTCIHYKSFPHIKELTWQIQDSSHQTFLFQYTLYKVTSDDSTVFLIKLITQHSSILNQVSFFLSRFNVFSKLIERTNTLLTESCFSLFQFEGVIIECSIRSVWDFLMRLDKLKKIAPECPFDGDCEGLHLVEEVGGFVDVYMNNHKQYVRVKTVKCDKKNKWKWVGWFYVEGNEAFVVPKHLMIITVNQINEEECHVAWFDDFKEPARPEFIKELEWAKKYIMEMLQDYLENFFSEDIERENQT